jgi:cytochrome c biogenesis protein CcmG, thiol:disulfide interchange protein DsbE
MSSSPRRSPRPRSSASSPSAASRRPLVVVVGVITIVLLALGVALSVGSGGGGDTTATGDDPVVDRGTGEDGPGAGAGPTVATVPDDTPATVEGTPLPPLPEAGADPAVGATLPVLSGTTLDGDAITIPEPGRPTMIVFLAHWCPHCQAEVPVVQRWVDDGGLPSDVDLVTVSTAADSRRPNHPPAAWLDREGWTAPVLVDGANTAAEAAGLTGFPFFVGVDSEGEVVSRTSGQLTEAQLTAIAESLTAGGA